MNDVIIRIIDTDNNVRGDLDLSNFNDFPLAINKGIVNLDNLQARTGTFTKTFKVPNTKNNSNLLSSVDNINSRKDYKGALSRKPCIIIVNNNAIEKGFLQVTNVLNGFELESFDLVFYGNNIDWVKDAAEKNINTITFSNSPEVYNSVNIKLANQSDSDSYDHAYPYIDRSGDLSYKTVYYLRSLIKKGLNSLGWNVFSSFIDSPKIKKLVCDFDLKFKVTDAEVALTKSRAGFVGSAQTIPAFSDRVILFNDKSTSPNEDTNSNFNTATGKYTAPQNGAYIVEFLFAVDNAGGYNFKLVKNGDSLTSIGSGVVLQENGNDLPPGVPNGQGGYTYEYNLLANDTISIYANAEGVGSSYDIVEGFNGEKQTYINVYRKSEIEFGDTYNLSDVIPKDITLLDVINDFTRMFNIYYWTDMKSKSIYFEPRDEFFKSQQTAINWSDKLDINKNYEIDYVSSYKRNIEFKYRDLENDKWLKGWQDINKREYARYNHVLPARFAEGTYTISLDLFCASYAKRSNKAYSGSIFNPNESPITIRLWSEFTDGSLPLNEIKDYRPKIYSFNNGIQKSLNGIFRLLNYLGTVSAQIPYGIFESYDNVSTDINLSFTGSDGLFNTYYSNMFKNIEEGGRLIAYFNLTPADIENLDFRKLVYINSPSSVKGYYLIEKIIDYNPVNNNLTKVSLFKYENLGSVSIDNTQEGNNDNETDNGNNPPDLQPILIEDGNQLIEVWAENPINNNLEPVYK